MNKLLKSLKTYIIPEGFKLKSVWKIPETKKSTESKVQRMLRKIKSKLPIQDYKGLYPTGSYPGKFYRIAKLHKIQPNGHVDDLPIWPIVSNTATATCNLLMYLA